MLDTGPGLKVDELEQVWQRFVRGSAASAKAPGMGLGLSLVRAVALAHGGTDNGGAGLHPEYGPDYFAAFVIDPDGYRIEAVITGTNSPASES